LGRAFSSAFVRGGLLGGGLRGGLLGSLRLAQRLAESVGLSDHEGDRRIISSDGPPRPDHFLGRLIDRLLCRLSGRRLLQPWLWLFVRDSRLLRVHRPQQQQGQNRCKTPTPGTHGNLPGAQPNTGNRPVFEAEALSSAYLMACGFIGEPVPPVMTNGGPQKKNS
jgi:hypothetical protein